MRKLICNVFVALSAAGLFALNVYAACVPAAEAMRKIYFTAERLRSPSISFSSVIYVFHICAQRMFQLFV